MHQLFNYNIKTSQAEGLLSVWKYILHTQSAPFCGEHSRTTTRGVSIHESICLSIPPPNPNMPPTEDLEKQRVVDNAVSHGASIIAMIEWLRGDPKRQKEIEQIVDGANRDNREGQLEMTGKILSTQSQLAPQLDS